jgi:hypothetical protein
LLRDTQRFHAAVHDRDVERGVPRNPSRRIGSDVIIVCDDNYATLCSVADRGTRHAVTFGTGANGFMSPPPHSAQSPTAITVSVQRRRADRGAASIALAASRQLPSELRRQFVAGAGRQISADLYAMVAITKNW